MAEACDIIISNWKTAQTKDTLNNHKDGDGPWWKVGVDLFELDGGDYLLTIDYYSGYFEVDRITTTTSNFQLSNLHDLQANGK